MIVKKDAREYRLDTESTQRLVTEEIEMLKVVLRLVMRSKRRRRRRQDA